MDSMNDELRMAKRESAVLEEKIRHHTAELSQS
jgi:hypothetical protein